ncbi:phospholipase A2-like [Mixophyes fleayi]|uniref:phospholipase A2-like n=1 Tax=Mixophyes fleayi TaxID=3061075 RepID=UPI003F4DD1A0
MTSILLLLLGTVLVAVSRGGVMQFGFMVHRVTGRLPFTSYLYYGCHCGPGGRDWPIDDIDWCCHTHDCCYDNLYTMGCKPIIVPYRFSYRNGNLTCVDPDLGGCARQTCECDREIALCFQRYNDNYSIGNTFFFKKTKCWGSKPGC